MSTTSKSTTLANPRATALAVAAGFIVLVGLLAVGAAFAINTFQEVRRDQAQNEARGQGQELTPDELDRRYPLIEIF